MRRLPFVLDAALPAPQYQPLHQAHTSLQEGLT